MIFSRLLFTLVNILFFLQACGPGRAVTESSTDQPDWVKRRPISPGYYIGIGWAQKTPNVYQYQQTARQNGLADLAGEISVNISSNSVLHTFESNLGFREDFTSAIQARTQEQLEGYDIVDTWEDQNNYWIYYRLSESRHREIKEKRRNDASFLSAGLLDNALQSLEKGNIRLSLVQMINSMEAIKNYLDDPLPVEFRNRNVHLGNEIFSNLSSVISQMEITPLYLQIQVKRGEEIKPGMLKFKLKNQITGPAVDFPLLAEYTERPIRNNRARTGKDGMATFSIDAVRSSKSFETFTVTADMESIIAEATTDPVIRRLTGRFLPPRAVVRINILNPVIKMISREENFGQEMTAGYLKESFRRNAIDAGYIIDENTKHPDYIIRILATTTSAGGSGAYKNALLKGTITVEIPDGNIIYHNELEGFRGSHFDYSRAGEEAFRQAARRMDRSFFREIDEALKKLPPR